MLNKQKEILWVDDEPYTLVSVSSLLADQYNTKVTFASTISGACVKIDTQKYDIVIIDVYLPLGDLSNKHQKLLKAYLPDQNQRFGLSLIAALLNSFKFTAKKPAPDIVVLSGVDRQTIEATLGEDANKIKVLEKSSFFDGKSQDKFISDLFSSFGLKKTITPVRSGDNQKNNGPEIVDSGSLRSRLIDLLHEEVTTLRSVDASFSALIELHRTFQSNFDEDRIVQKITNELKRLIEEINRDDSWRKRGIPNEIKYRLEQIALRLTELNSQYELSSAEKRIMVDLINKIILDDNFKATPQEPIKALKKLIHEYQLGCAVMNADVSRKQIHRLSLNARTIISILQKEYRKTKKLEVFDFRDLLDTCLEELTPTARHAGVEVRCIGEKGITAYGDEEQLRIALIAIIENGLKYSGSLSTQFKGGPTASYVDVKLSNQEGMAEIIVQSWGVPIYKHELKAVLERGRRGEKAIETNHTGSGYGLYSANRIIKNHEGFIYITSEKQYSGQYLTEVVIQIPLSTSQ